MLRIIFPALSEPADRREFISSSAWHFPTLRQLLRSQWHAYVQFHTRSPSKLQFAGLIGLLTFPLYYFVWTWQFPQAYESLTMRSVGAALCLGIYCRSYWPKSWMRWYLPYAYLVFILCLPTFFTLMTLLNGASTIWLMSAMAAMMFVMLLYDIVNAVVVCILGSAIGLLIFSLLGGESVVPAAYWASLPVIAFPVLVILVFAFSERPVTYDQLNAARTLASNIAHEMRTPLLGIRLDCDRLSSDLTLLEAPARWAYANGWEGGTILTDRRMVQMHGALNRIAEHTRAANMVIEMLLANVSQGRRMSDDYAIHALDRVIDEALSRYHFRDGERELVRVSGDRGVQFWGSDVLMVHVLFNMLKNALTAIEAKKSGTIDIVVSMFGDEIQLHVRDSGAGIADDLLPCIFLPFISSSRRMEGSGMGLAFCKRVIDSFGGSISCISKRGEGTAFTITLPLVRAPNQPTQAAT